VFEKDVFPQGRKERKKGKKGKSRGMIKMGPPCSWDAARKAQKTEAAWRCKIEGKKEANVQARGLDF